MTIYIVARAFSDACIVESVWSTMELAESARNFHALDSNIPIYKYIILTRELNKAKNNG